jgi:formylmethanofuran dehydrogenase subunit B
MQFKGIKMIHENIICPVCGMACDDIIVEMEEDHVVEVREACEMGASKFYELNSEHRIVMPSINGRKAEWREAIARSADLLKDARRPIIFIGAETSTEAIKVGIQMAEHLGGVVDNNVSICHGPTVLGIQEVGFPSCTIGNVKNRADMVIFWGCNPMDSHPRHMSMKSSFPKGFFTEDGRKGKKIVVVDVRRSTTSNITDDLILVNPGSDYAVMAALRAILAGHADVMPSEVGGVKKERLVELVEEMKKSNFVAFFIGLGIASSRGKDKNQAQILSVVADLTAYTKVIVITNRGHCNVAGFNQVCTWSTGFPYAVDFSRRCPRYNPGEFTTMDMLARKEVDAMLLVAADLGAHLPKKGVEQMVNIPLITIDIAPCPSTMISDIVLPGVIDGMECGSSFYRLDNVPIRARKFLDPPFGFTTSNEDTLKQIFEEIKK